MAQAKPAAAAPTAPASGEVTGTVLSLDGEELILDLGSAQGAVDGALVEIWRPVKLKHPVTGKVLTDRFRIGTLQLVQVRVTMSLARPNGPLTRGPEKGDVVILQVAAKPSAPGSPEEKPQADGDNPYDEEKVTPADAEARELATLLDSLKGADLVTRIRKYEDYVRTKPNGRFARVLYEEAASLRRLLEAEQKGKPGSVRTSVVPSESVPGLVSFHAPKEAVEGVPLAIAVELSDAATGALLHVRPKGQPAFLSIPMMPEGPGYWMARIPADRMVVPQVEYFIEATTGRGGAVALVGTPSSPEKIDVLVAPRVGPPSKVGATAVLLTDYADYNKLKGNDRVWQTEGWFGLRYGDTGVRAVRTGFGVYRGVGGTLRELDEMGLPGRPVGLTYGYIETEVGFHRLFSMIGRMAVGLINDGLTGGGQVLFRIGNDQDTNLLLGGELLGGVGLRGFTQLELNTFKKVPILLRTEVTNQPAGYSKPPSGSGEPKESTGAGEVGARGIVQVGYRFVPGLTLSARVSFQGRTINHAGPGFGGALGYEW
jgi:hypothetical protein